MARYRHQKYTYTRRYGSVQHQWELVGPRGGLHFTAGDGRATCGLELHYAAPPPGAIDEAPSHVDCWLIGGRCWHDGTSLYAEETLWPRIAPLLKAGDHDGIFRILEREADQRFERERAPEAGTIG